MRCTTRRVPTSTPCSWNSPWKVGWTPERWSHAPGPCCHANLRAAFEQEGLTKPVQVIPNEVVLPWRFIDLSTNQKPWSDLAAEDRVQRFDVTAPPLLRFTLAKLGPREHRLLLTHHHLLLDGWSMPVLVEELLTTRELPPVRQYRTYLGWLSTRDRTAAEDAWHEALSGLEEPTCLARTEAEFHRAAPETVVRELPELLTSALTN